MSEHTRSRSQHRRPTDHDDAARADHVTVETEACDSPITAVDPGAAVDICGPAAAAGRGDRP